MVELASPTNGPQTSFCHSPAMFRHWKLAVSKSLRIGGVIVIVELALSDSTTST